MKVVAHNPAIERAADALRRYEMKGRLLLDWDKISSAQRMKWCEKAKVALDAAAKTLTSSETQS